MGNRAGPSPSGLILLEGGAGSGGHAAAAEVGGSGDAAASSASLEEGTPPASAMDTDAAQSTARVLNPSAAAAKPDPAFGAAAAAAAAAAPGGSTPLPMPQQMLSQLRSREAGASHALVADLQMRAQSLSAVLSRPNLDPDAVLMSQRRAATLPSSLGAGAPLGGGAAGSDGAAARSIAAQMQGGVRAMLAAPGPPPLHQQQAFPAVVPAPGMVLQQQPASSTKGEKGMPAGAPHSAAKTIVEGSAASYALSQREVDAAMARVMLQVLAARHNPQQGCRPLQKPCHCNKP